MQRPGQDPVAKDDVPWWMKYAGRGLGTVGSISEFIITTQYESRYLLFRITYLSPSPPPPFSFFHTLFNNFMSCALHEIFV